MTTRLVTFALVTGALVAAPSALAAPAPLRVTSISPQVADRGELVTIAGGGFGAHNLRVTVGGEPVELVGATGSRASFRVPRLGAVGDVVVEARNPGGHVGRIDLRVRFDGQTEAVVDDAAAVNAAIGSDGGTIGIAGMTLAIPAGAVPEGTTITATPLRSLRGSPFAAAPVGLKLEPSGLVLLKPATLTLPKPSGAGTVVGFGFDGNGDELHLVPARVVGDAVQLKVWHFSGAGTLTATLAELNSVFDYLPTPAHLQAEHVIATALAVEAGGGESATPAILTALSQWQIRSVLRGLQVARDEGRLDFFELAFGEWQAWYAYVQEYDSRFTPSESQFFADVENGVDRPTATQGAAAVGRRLLGRCLGPGIPRSALRDVLRLASAVNLAGLLIEQHGADDGTGRNLPDGRSLANGCVDVELAGVDHAAALARNRDNRFVARARVVFWDRSLSTTVPIRYRLADITNGPPTPLASGTSATGTFEDTISPGSLGSRTLELTADLDSSGTDTVLRAIFDQLSFSVPVRERLDVQARRSGDPAFGDSVGAVNPGSTVLLRIRLAGDGTAGKTITLTHDGNGTLPATVTTDSAGEATVTYTAPASPQIELVNATITDGAFTSGDAIVITTREPVTIAITPSFAFTSIGSSVQFSATVTGTPDQRVSWNATAGTISSTGRYTAGLLPGTFRVTATSLADPSVTESAFVQVSTSIFGPWSGVLRSSFDSDGVAHSVQPIRVSVQPPLSGPGNPFAGTTGSADDAILIWDSGCEEALPLDLRPGTFSRLTPIGDGVFQGPWSRYCGVPLLLPGWTVTARLDSGGLTVRWHGTMTLTAEDGTETEVRVLVHELLLTTRG
jgi:hypothetical protein